MDTPMKSSAADRKRPTLWDGLIVLIVAALAAALAFAVLPRGGSGGDLTAVVTVDGSIIATLPLYSPYASEDSQFYRLDDIPYPLVLEYKTGAIRVLESQCPTNDCVHVGWISQTGQQIVCLPNRLVVTLKGEGYQSYDAITG